MSDGTQKGGSATAASGSDSALSRIRARVVADSATRSQAAASDAMPSPPAKSRTRPLQTDSSQTKKRARGVGILGRASAQSSPTAKGSLSRAGSAGNLSDLGDPQNDDQVQQLEPDKTCYGCERAHLRDNSWLTPNQHFAWLYADGKGNYCRDCAGLYRVWLKVSMNVPLFERWLQSPESKLAWQGMLLSYISLKREGCAHINLSGLQAREKLLKFVFGMVQVPFPSFIVVEVDANFLAAYAQDPDGSKQLCATSSGTVVGLQAALSPFQGGRSGNRFVTKAQASRVWPVNRWVSLPASFRPSWDDQVSEHAIVSAGPLDDQPDEPDPSTDSRQTDGASVQAQVYATRVEVLQDSAKVLIAAFCNNPYDSMEKHFTPLAGKIAKCRQDALNTSLDSVTASLMSLGTTVNAIKKLVRPIKEYSKSGRRHLLEPMRENLTEMYAYATKMKLKVLCFLRGRLGGGINTCSGPSESLVFRCVRPSSEAPLPWWTVEFGGLLGIVCVPVGRAFHGQGCASPSVEFCFAGLSEASSTRLSKNVARPWDASFLPVKAQIWLGEGPNNGPMTQLVVRSS